MGCNSCSNLKYEKKVDGKVNGSLYYCSKLKTYVSGASDGCDNYKKDLMRKSYEKDEIYRNGKNYWNDDSIGPKIFLIVILIILGIIFNLF